MRSAGGIRKNLTSSWTLSSTSPMLELAQMPAPLPVSPLDPDQIIEDILVSTLTRVQASAKPELAAAAARYITLLRQKAL